MGILPGGYPICTCMLERHVGFPCRHFFAVMNKHTEHEFNIMQVHLHWHDPQKILLSQGREWIYLDRRPSFKLPRRRAPESPKTVQIISRRSSPDDLPQAVSDAPLKQESNKAIASGQNVRSAPSTPSRKRSHWVELHDEMQKLLKLDPTIDIFNDTLQYLKSQRGEVTKRRRIVNKLPESSTGQVGEGVPLNENLDPLTFPKYGRKLSRRIKSSTE